MAVGAMVYNFADRGGKRAAKKPTVAARDVEEADGVELKGLLSAEGTRDEDETVEHFMGVCPYYARLRGQIFNDYYMSMTDICESHSLKQILKFVKGSKRLDIIKPPATR